MLFLFQVHQVMLFLFQVHQVMSKRQISQTYHNLPPSRQQLYAPSEPWEIEAWFQWTTNRKWHIANRMVTWSMTSRDPNSSRSCPRYIWMQISKKTVEIEAQFQWTTNGKWHMVSRMCLDHSFGTSCRLIHEPLVPTHWTASNDHWRLPCSLEWVSCCWSQHLWATFLRGL